MKVNKEELQSKIEQVIINTLWTADDIAIQIMETINPLIIALEHQAEEIKLDNKRIDNLLKVLHAIPECEQHGECIPHAIEWINDKIKN